MAGELSLQLPPHAAFGAGVLVGANFERAWADPDDAEAMGALFHVTRGRSNAVLLPTAAQIVDLYREAW